MSWRWLFNGDEPRPIVTTPSKEPDLLDERLYDVLIKGLEPHGLYPPFAVLNAMMNACHGLPNHHEVLFSLSGAFAGILAQLPREYFFSSPHEVLAQGERRKTYAEPTVPLHDILKSCGQAISDACLPILFDKPLVEQGLLSDVRKQPLENEAHLNGLSLYERRKKAVPAPQDRDEPPHELSFLYLKDTFLLNVFNTPVPFRIPESVRSEHVLHIAPTGSGKTQWIQQDILHLLEEGKTGIVVIDSQNQMIPKLERLRIARDRITIIDPTDEVPPALNMFIYPERNYSQHMKDAIEAATLEQFGWIFASLDQELSGRMNTLFTFVARVLLAMAPNVNMMTLLEFLRIDTAAKLHASPFWPYIESLDDQTRYFFDERFCKNEFNTTKSGVADRMLGIMRVPSFNRMFMASANKLDLYQELKEKRIVVFNTYKRMLGNDPSAVFGRYAISLFIRAAFEREEDKNPPQAFLYIDEASEYFGKKDSSDTLFTQLRKYECGTYVAFQELSQLAQQTHTLTANTTTKLAARLDPRDAQQLASSMRTSAEELLSTRKHENRFEVSCYIKDLMPHAVKVTFPYGAVEYADKLTDQEHRELREKNRRRVGDIYEPTVPPKDEKKPAAEKQQMNETSLRDTDLPLPKSPDKPFASPGGWEDC